MSKAVKGLWKVLKPKEKLSSLRVDLYDKVPATRLDDDDVVDDT